MITISEEWFTLKAGQARDYSHGRTLSKFVSGCCDAAEASDAEDTTVAGGAASFCSVTKIRHCCVIIPIKRDVSFFGLLVLFHSHYRVLLS